MSLAPSTLYKNLSKTATSFLSSCLPSPLGSNIPSKPAILSTLAPSFRMSFGHKHFVFTTPPLQGTKTGEEFADHLAAMAERLHTWDIHATQVIVDERQRSVVVRGDFRMTPIPGETVVNDVVIIMSMDESGERLVECTEFVDPVAAGEIRRLMVAKE